jgi:peptide/nickel transport system substrate-binding protein
LEALREEWLDAPSSREQKRIAEQIQVQFFQDVTHVPLGHYYAPTCYRKDLAGIEPGFSVMHGVRRI